MSFLQNLTVQSRTVNSPTQQPSYVVTIAYIVKTIDILHNLMNVVYLRPQCS